jgi:hypothetical protein
MGYIDAMQVEQLADALGKTAYAQYLRQLLQEQPLR